MKPRWFLNVAAYSVSGAIVSASVGAFLGVLGSLAVPDPARVPAVVAALVVGVFALARTLGVIRVPFPQPRRQTRDSWVKRGNPTLAAVRWGVDIGLVYNTRFTFPGIWFITLIAVATGDPGFGSALLGSYWLGRLVPVWIGPLLMRDARETPQLLLAVEQHLESFRVAHAAGLILGIVATTLALATEGGA